MSPVEAVREFVNRRLSAAAEEIFSGFLPTLVQYQEQSQTQKRLLDITCREATMSQRTDEPQQHFCREEQCWYKQRHFSLDQEPKPPKTKEKKGVDQFANLLIPTDDDGQKELRENLDSHNSVRELIDQRLIAAAGEIFTEFQQTVFQYQEEIKSQQKLLEITLIHQKILHKTNFLEQQMNILGCKELEASQNKNENDNPETSQIHEEQEDTDPKDFQIKEEEIEAYLIKEEEAESYSSNDEEPLGPKHDDYCMMFPSYEQIQSIQPEPDSGSLLCQDSVVTGSHHKEKTHLVDLELMKKTRLGSKKKHHSRNPENSPFIPQNPSPVVKKTYRSKKPLSCGICGKNLQSPSLLMLHMRIHTGEKPHSCETCGKSFSQRGNLMVHMRIHSGENPYSCETCGKSFNRNTHLLRHMKIHTGEKPFSCQACCKNFSEKSHLLRHMRIHTREKQLLRATW